jgi:hypothetical protein
VIAGCSGAIEGASSDEASGLHHRPRWDLSIRPDLGTPPDLSSAAPDLSGAPPDLSSAAPDLSGPDRSSPPDLAIVPDLSGRPTGARLLHRSGFEAGTWLDPVSGPAYNQTPALHGVDATTGFSWDTPFYGVPYNLWEVLSADNVSLAPGSATDYIQNVFETVTGPSGAPTRTFKMSILKPSATTCCIQDPLESAWMTRSVTDFYLRYWMRFNPELLGQAQAQGGNYWRLQWEMKTLSDYRMMTYVYNNNGVPSWHAHADDVGLSHSGAANWFWADYTSIPVPLDQWFFVEIYLHRADDTSGRFYFGVNGRTVEDHWGPNYGASHDPIGAMMFVQLYGQDPTNWYQWIDDLEVWDGPPCSSLPCGAPPHAQ